VLVALTAAILHKRRYDLAGKTFAGNLAISHRKEATAMETGDWTEEGGLESHDSWL
jgi:hypothetical protein